jgi:hypothetical protein
LNSQIGLSVISFLGAFLLFYLELLISKSLLPVLGGAYFVWVGCVTFFTLVMLFSNWTLKLFFDKFGDKTSYLFFFFLSISGIFSFPIKIPNELNGSEVAFIFTTLAKNIGISFFILSAASLVIQKLSSNLFPQKNPYTLYGISNLGSLLGLLLFPLVFEPFLLTDQKFLIVYILYISFIILFGIILFTNFKKISKIIYIKDGNISPTWVFLSASTTTFFLATTNFITYDIGSAPLFWAIPLGIFLLSFILNFKEKPWRPKYFLIFSAIVALILEVFLKTFFSQILAQYLILFAACLKINQLLYDSRPPEKSLPSFYFSISLGGALGSFAILYAGPTIFKYNKLLSADYLLVLLFLTTGLWFHLKSFKYKKIFLVMGVFGILGFFIMGFLKDGAEYFVRNFYGIYRVKVGGDLKVLINGTILHGTQDLSHPERPLAYYGYNSSIGEIMLGRKFTNIASVGLGVGNLLAYGKPNQTWDIIEIDPEVINIAKDHFSFIKNCPSKLNFLVGDGRVVLNKQENSKYDLIIIDAFSGDNIPFHLLSLEALKIYLDKTKNWGLIAFHISNNYHDFFPLLKNSAKELGVNFYFPRPKYKLEKGIKHSDWFFMEKISVEKENLVLKPKPWTDSYYNFWDTLKLFK